MEIYRMKKSLFAIAAVTAFAGAAQAQSSVTVYGILDVGYTGGQARVDNARQTVNRISNSMESGSRLGFRGNEDLGQGLSAQFVFELGINPAGDNMSNTWTPNIRQGYVGLTQKGLGDVRVGTQNTLYWEQGGNMTGQLAQTAGSMLAPSSVGTFYGTAAQNLSADPVATNNLGSGSASAAYTVRTANTIRLATQRMAGLVVKGAYTLSNSNSSQLPTRGTGATSGYRAGTDNQNGYQLALDYVFQKANVQASYASFTSENPYGNVVGSFNSNGGNPQQTTNGEAQAWGVTGGVNVKDAQTLVTASYDFGVLKAYAGWTNRKVASSLNSNMFAKRTAQEIGVRSFITPKIEGWASAGNGRYTEYGAGSPTANITGYQVGSNYWLSKRSNLYAIYGQNGTSSTSASPAMNLSQYSIGIRHTF
jgi:predicted porin